MREGQLAPAIRILDEAGNRGDVDALALLANWCLSGAIGHRDLPRGRELLARARAIGHVDAALMEIALTANGSGGEADWSGALKLLEDAARTDPVAAQQTRLLEAMNLADDGGTKHLPASEQIGSQPDVFRYTKFLTAEECAHIAHAASDLLEPSYVVDPATGRHVADPVRTSHGGVIGPAREDLVVRAINRRIADVTGTAVAQGEPLSVLHYSSGQQYHPHLDALPGVTNQRIKTVLVYLNQGYVGGETRFASSDLQVAGRAGDAIVFDNCWPDGRIKKDSLHAGLPVRHGVKWLATRWIRAEPYDPWA